LHQRCASFSLFLAQVQRDLNEYSIDVERSVFAIAHQHQRLAATSAGQFLSVAAELRSSAACLLASIQVWPLALVLAVYAWVAGWYEPVNDGTEWCAPNFDCCSSLTFWVSVQLVRREQVHPQTVQLCAADAVYYHRTGRPRV
jgi:hypothetical protein